MKLKFIALASLVLIPGMRFTALPAHAFVGTTVASAVTRDTDHNGRLDQFDVTFTGDIDSTSLDASQFTVTGCNHFAPNFVVTAVEATDTDAVSITVAEETDGTDTAVVCTVNVNGVVALDDSTILGSVLATDGAAPVIYRFRYMDDDYDGYVDRLVADYSEPLADDTTASPTDFTISNAGDFSGISVASGETLAVGPSLGWIDLPLNEGTVKDTHDDSGSLLVATTGAYSVSDVAGNVDNYLGDQTQADENDLAKAQIDSVTYRDLDHNGKIDALSLSFTETVSASSYLWPNQLSVEDDAGFTDLQFTSDTEDLITSETDGVTIPMTESSVVATYTDGSIVLGRGPEESGYYLYDLADNGTNPTDEAFAAIDTYDGAAPVLISSTPKNNTNFTSLNANLLLDFSEPIDDESVSSWTVGLQEGASSSSADGAEVTIDPTLPLIANSTYHILIGDAFYGEKAALIRRIKGGMSDFAGNNVADQVITFTTNIGGSGYIPPTDFGGPDAAPVPPDTTPTGEVLGTTDTSPTAPDTDGNGVRPGDYIRGASWTTVYYVSADMVRHPIMDHQTYFTYEDSWAPVKVLADDKLKDYPMGSLVLPKAGTVLVKIGSMNDVFALEDGANGATLLRKVPDEATATQVFGAHWADYVIDLSVVVFPHFGHGTPIDSTFVVDMSKMKTRMSLNNN